MPTTTIPAVPEDNCFDGIDNDVDGLRDCADPDCNGKTDGPCDTGEPDPCSAGTVQCQDGGEICVPNNQPAESIDAGNCDDLLDNDCDGLFDADDPGCQASDVGDVSLTGLQAPGRIYVRTNSDTEIQVVVEATGTPGQLATISLEASSPAGVNVQIDQASITEEITASGNALTILDANDKRRKRTTTTTIHDDDDDHEPNTTTTIKDDDHDDHHYDVVTRFVFNATINGTQKGTWAVNWTAKTVSPTTALQDANPDNDVLTATTQVVVTTSFRQRIRELFTKMLERRQ